MASADNVESRMAAKLKALSEARRDGRCMPRPTETEVNYLDEALQEVGAAFIEGDLNLACTRCGGVLEAVVKQSGYAVSCKNCDLLTTVRGI